MKENKYDDPVFFEKYSHMARSEKGLDGAGEWECLRELLPEFKGRRVLDLGCGYGWHCIYALENGASDVTGVDISEKMLSKAAELDKSGKIKYVKSPLEEIDFEEGSFDTVISSLVFHYIESFDTVAEKVSKALKSGGDFVFSVEHPIFTSYGTQDWYRDEKGEILHFPVDNYFIEGKREAVFLGEKVTKYHKTLEAYTEGLTKHGFEIIRIKEPQPPEHMMDIPEMKDELRRPMMLIISAKKR